MENNDIRVYIFAEDVYGTVESLGAYASIVTYTSGGIMFKELLENEDFEVIDYE